MKTFNFISAQSLPKPTLTITSVRTLSKYVDKNGVRVMSNDQITITTDGVKQRGRVVYENGIFYLKTFPEMIYSNYLIKKLDSFISSNSVILINHSNA